MSDWIEVEFLIGEDQEAGLTEQLNLAFPSQTISSERLGDPSSIDPKKMLPDIKVKLYLEASQDTVEMRAELHRLASSLVLSPPTIRELEPIDWQEAWRKTYAQFVVGDRFLIVPEWESIADEFKPGVDTGSLLEIRLNPGLAFGTGLHETTQLCLETLGKLNLEGQSVLDLGAGSGILSIASILSGASTVDAIEIDGDAVKNLEVNLALNSMTGSVIAKEGGLDVARSEPYDLVIANILAVILVDLIENQNLLRKVLPQSGRILFSGIIEEQMPAFVSTVERFGGAVEAVTQKGEWACFIVKT